MSNIDINRELIGAVEQFLYREARLLDERLYQQWQGLLAEDIRYIIPNRFAPFLDPKLRESEEFLSLNHELSSGVEPPHRDENLLTLSIRVMRAFKQNSWTDNPPARTTRLVSNVEVLPAEPQGCFQVYSNVLISYSRHQKDNVMFSARRRDILRREAQDFRLARREVILDWNVVTGPSLGIIF